MLPQWEAYAPQLEKVHMQQWRPSEAKKKKKNRKKLYIYDSESVFHAGHIVIGTHVLISGLGIFE